MRGLRNTRGAIVPVGAAELLEEPSRLCIGACTHLAPTTAAPLSASWELAREAMQHAIGEPEVQCCWCYQHDSPPVVVGAQNGGGDEQPDTDTDANERHSPRVPISDHRD